MAAAASTSLAGAEENPQTAPGPQALDDWHEESASHLVSDPTAPSPRGRDRSPHRAALLTGTGGGGRRQWSTGGPVDVGQGRFAGLGGGQRVMTRTGLGLPGAGAPTRAGSLCRCLCRGLSVQR